MPWEFLRWVFLVRNALVDPFKPGDQFSPQGNFLDKHLYGSYPKATSSIECTVDDQVFFCFGMFGDADDLIVFSFIVTISAWLNHWNAFPLMCLCGVHGLDRLLSLLSLPQPAYDQLSIGRTDSGYCCKRPWRYA